MLKIANLVNEVQRYLSVGSWFQIFYITDPTYCELTLDVLATFEKKKGKVSWNRPDALSFQILEKCFVMSYTKLALLMGVCDEEFTRTMKYTNLPLLSVPSLPQWHCLCSNNLLFDPRSPNASTLWSPGLCMIHSLLSRLVTGRGASTGVVTRRDFQYLISMEDGIPLYLGYILATALYHQVTTRRDGIIFVGPYILRLSRVLNLLETMDQVTIAEKVKPITILGLHAMGLFIPQGVNGNNPLSTNYGSRS